jgi:hypothetical protein
MGLPTDLLPQIAGKSPAEKDRTLHQHIPQDRNQSAFLQTATKDKTILTDLRTLSLSLYRPASLVKQTILLEAPAW